MTERGELEVVPQIQSGAPDDGDGAEARIVSALADHVRDALVAPEESHLIDEVREEIMEIGVGSRAGGHGAAAVTEHAAVGRQPIAVRIAQHFTPVELIK